MSAWTILRPCNPPLHNRRDPSPSTSQSIPQHQVPFGAPQAIPSSLSFGFGAAPLPPPTKKASSGVGFCFGGGAATTRLSLTSTPHAAAGPSRRRRRSTSPPEVDEQVEDEVNCVRKRREIKKLRGLASGKSVVGIGERPASRTGPHGVTADDIDLGKMLTTLPKPALLTLVTSLLSQQPSLKPIILSLLPAPSLESIEPCIVAGEKMVTDAIPRTAGVRDEYAWGRVRGPLEQFVLDARGWLAAFSPPGEVAQPHPSEIFAFLAALTASVRRLETLLPPAPAPSHGIAVPTLAGMPLNPLNPLTATLIPLLTNNWHLLITRLAGMAAQGKVFGAERVRGWKETLEGLCVPAPDSWARRASAGREGEVARTAVVGVRVRFCTEIGWMAGGAPTKEVMMQEEDI